MPESFPAYVSVDYTDGENQHATDYPTIEDKLEKAITVTAQALAEYRNPVIMWTGGKDSTLVVYFVREVAREHDLPLPPAVFIDHYQHFPEVTAFVERWATTWNIDLITTQHEEIGRLNRDPGDPISVDELSPDTQHEIREKLEYADDTFPFLLDTLVGNHLLKTVPLNTAITTHNVDGVFSGVRWDEQEARSTETFFSPRHDTNKYPAHDRIHPILQFTEHDVWRATWEYLVPDTVPDYATGRPPTAPDDLPDGLDPADLPVCPKYWEGYRSLGSAVSTMKTTDEPAWLQDLDHTTERAGRAQDKENLMQNLRDLGYM